MSKTQCRHFVQNAWKKELCSNCFKSREEHTTTQEQFKPNITRTANNLKKVAHKVQGILRMKESHTQVRSKRKNVAFPESLTEIIGYDGGDDFGLDDDTSHDHDDPDNTNESSFEIDDLPDSEEERALGNLTRANTNFNTVTANLNNAIEEAKTATKNFSTLMLGRAPKNNDGKKTTLLVSVKPFGGDDSVPTARRPSDKKSPETPKPKPTVEMSEITKPEVSSLKSVSKKPVEEKSIETTSKTITTTTNNTTSSSLGKIVDMPLITSTNLISVIRDETSVEKIEQKRTTSIARTPAIKKPENEKPKIVAQQQNADQNAARNHKNLELSNGVELNLSPIRSNDQTRDTETSSFGKEISNYKSSLTADKRNNLADLTERKVEGEAAKNFSEKFSFEESRESAGEPDGKADEEVIAEPPALPKSPPPIETTFVRTCLESEKRTLLSSTSTSAIAEPRTSFLHGMTEPKVKPVVPQKPLTLPAKAIGSSLASLLSENRAYEFRISQSQRNSALVHSQSESQLCAGTDEVSSKKFLEKDSQSKISAELYSHLTQTELFKAECVKIKEKEQQMEEDDAEDDDDSEGDHPRSCSKRRMAPQPPASISEDASSSLFARNPATMVAKSDCPVVREKEKRERASSCSPKFRKAVSDAPDPCATRPPEPAPRRNISLSQDSLAAATNCERVTEEKKKARSKFSLKKFLRMGSRKDVDMTAIGSRSEEIPSTPQPKPRLEIIHPLELDGAAVQVLRNDKTTSEDTTDSKSENLNSGTSPAHGAQHVTTRPSKPPPPPRTQSLDESSKPRVSAPKPQQQQQQTNSSSSNSSKPLVGKSWQPSNGSSASDSIYANLGKFRPIQCN